MFRIPNLLISPPPKAMASLNSAECTHVSFFELPDGIVLQVNVSGFSNGHNAKVELRLQNCSRTWILHWGCLSKTNKKWFVPAFYPSGTRVHKKTTLRTPFVKTGDGYVVVIELRDPKINAIEFVLKDTKHDKWLKLNGRNFMIKLHEEIDVEHDRVRNAKCLPDEISHEEDLENSLICRDICISSFSPNFSTFSSFWQGVSLKANTFGDIYAMSLEESSREMVGEKSNNVRFLRAEVPAWVKFPASIVIPFGVFERILSQDINKELGNKIARLREHVDRGDVSKLKTIRETVLQMKAPRKMGVEVRKKMKSSRVPWPRGPGDETWNRAWEAMKKVWASNWNERAFIDREQTNTSHENACVSILIQEHVRADYAFQTCTTNPVSGDASEIHTEVVKGSGEASVGRAMTSVTKKSDLRSPAVTRYANKSTGLYTNTKRSVVFRPDFVAENTKRHARRGVYDSVSLEKAERVVLDYSRDPMAVDLRFQTSIHSRIAEAGKIIEDMYGCVQEIEGVVQDGQVYVLQCRPFG